jgi:hypothetical protein
MTKPFLKAPEARCSDQAEPRTAPDGLQRPLRSRFRPQVSASVRQPLATLI